MLMKQGEGTSTQPTPTTKRARNQPNPEGTSSQPAPATKKACPKKLAVKKMKPT